jgi:hypothetical protein
MGDNEVLSSVEADILNTSRVNTVGVRPDGSVCGEAQGLVAGKGGERATFKAQGVGKILDGGGVSYRGAHF